MYTLYYSPGAASMCVHLALLESAAPYELRRVDLDAGAQHDPEYLALNPNGLVPTLLIDGVAMYESAACLMAVAEREAHAQLAPAAGSLQRAAWYQWIVHLANTVQPAFRQWFYDGDLDAPASVRATVREAARGRIEAAWTRLDEQLARHGPCLLGDRFSAADLMLLMVMRWSRNMPRPVTEWPALAAFAARMKARPSWQRLYELEGLSEWA